MVVILRDSGSNVVPNIIISEIKKIKMTDEIFHGIPLSDKDIVQMMLDKNRRYRIVGFGIFIGDAINYPKQRADLYTLNGTQGSLSVTELTPDIYVPVLYYEVNINEEAGRPFEFGFSINAIEVV
jgi:hypothetical protein